MSELFYQFVLFLNNLLFNNFGLTIIVLGVLSRLVFYPIFASQIKQAKKWEELRPKFDNLSNKYKNDKQRLALEQAKLMREAGVNPAAGCLPIILQIIMINLLYNSFYRFIKEGLDTKFLIWDLSKPDVIKLNLIKGSFPGVLVIITAVVQFIQIRMMTVKTQNKKEKGKEKEEKNEMAESLAQSQEMMAWMFPLMFLFLGTKWPSGLALYWTVATIMAIGQQWYLEKRNKTG